MVTHSLLQYSASSITCYSKLCWCCTKKNPVPSYPSDANFILLLSFSFCICLMLCSTVCLYRLFVIQLSVRFRCLAHNLLRPLWRSLLLASCLRYVGLLSRIRLWRQDRFRARLNALNHLLRNPPLPSEELLIRGLPSWWSLKHRLCYEDRLCPSTSRLWFFQGWSYSWSAFQSREAQVWEWLAWVTTQEAVDYFPVLSPPYSQSR